MQTTRIAQCFSTFTKKLTPKDPKYFQGLGFRVSAQITPKGQVHMGGGGGGPKKGGGGAGGGGGGGGVNPLAGSQKKDSHIWRSVRGNPDFGKWPYTSGFRV